MDVILTDTQVRDFLTDAVMGCGGWFDYVTIPNNSQTQGDIVITDDCNDLDGLVYYFVYSDVVREITAFADGLGMAVDDFMDGYYDACDADSIMQMVVFGEIIYG